MEEILIFDEAPAIDRISQADVRVGQYHVFRNPNGTYSAEHIREVSRGASGTGSNLANKLSDLSIDTDDPKLQHMAKGLADLVRPKIGEKDAKVNILELAHRFKCSTGPGHKQRGFAIEQVKHYCDNAIMSVQPEWQIIALGQGWTQPAARSAA